MVSVDKNLVTDIVKTQLGVDSPSEPLLNIAVDEVEQEIKNFCNIEEVPKELTYTYANIVVDLFRYRQEFIDATKKPVGDEDDGDDLGVNAGNMNSIRVGDTTITLGSGSDTMVYNKNMRSHQVNLDDVVLNYGAQLKKFRKMVW